MKTYRFCYPLKPLKIPSKNLPTIPQISSKPCPKYLQISSKNTSKMVEFPFFRSGAESSQWQPFRPESVWEQELNEWTVRPNQNSILNRLASRIYIFLLLTHFRAEDAATGSSRLFSASFTPMRAHHPTSYHACVALSICLYYAFVFWKGSGRIPGDARGFGDGLGGLGVVVN